MSITKLKSIFGRSLFLGPKNVTVAKDGFAIGGDHNKYGTIVYPGPNHVALFDDFMGDTGRSANMRANTDSTWAVIEGDTGNDTGTNVYITPGTSGICRSIISTTNSHTGPSPGREGFGAGIVSRSLSWKANQGSIPTDSKSSLRFATRLRFSGATDTGRQINIWAGLTDTNVLEAPVYDTGGAVITNATDAVGFWYSGGADTGWAAYSVNTGGTAQVVALDNTRQAIRSAGGTNNQNQWDVLELEIHHGQGDTGGTATFWVNGVPQGTIDGPVAMNAALTPQIYQWCSDTGGGTILDIDWVNVSAPRDTGS
jgi:hypothetical protein